MVYYDGYGYNFYYGTYGYYDYSVNPYDYSLGAGVIIFLVCFFMSFFGMCGVFCFASCAFEKQVEANQQYTRKIERCTNTKYLGDVFCQKDHKMEWRNDNPYYAKNHALDHVSCDICWWRNMVKVGSNGFNDYYYHCGICETDFCQNCAKKRLGME